MTANTIEGNDWRVYLGLVIFSCCLCCGTVLGQTGNNAVFGADGLTVTPSSAFVDASVVTGATATDICSVINYILAPPSTTPTGATIDARGFTGGTLDCTVGGAIHNPFANVVKGSTVLLPPGVIKISNAWVLPSNTRMVGSGSFNVTSIQATVLGANPMLQMCATGSSCTNISIEHVHLDGNKKGVLGVENVGAGDGSYVDDVSFVNVLSGLKVDFDTTGLGTTGSGPYSNLNVAMAPAPTCQPNCPYAIDLEASTRGLHGVTIIGDATLSGMAINQVCQVQPTAAVPGAILVRAGGNSIEDVHVEAFWDAIQIEPRDGASVVGGIFISNVTGGQRPSGPVTNVVHICGLSGGTSYGKCYVTGGTVSDVVVLGASSELNGMGDDGSCTGTGQASAILDDMQGTVIGWRGTTATKLTPAMYVLGGVVQDASTNPIGYSSFSSLLGVASGAVSSAVPTWIVGGGSPSGACSTNGTVYSNQIGNNTNTFWVCSGATWHALTLTAR